MKCIERALCSQFSPIVMILGDGAPGWSRNGARQASDVMQCKARWVKLCLCIYMKCKEIKYDSKCIFHNRVNMFVNWK